MVVVVFRFRSKPDADLEAMGALIEEMVGIVSQMPGFQGMKDFQAEDGEVAVLAEFDSVESVDAWKSHPEHLAAQARGRQEFFQDYRTQVCTEVRARTFP